LDSKGCVWSVELNTSKLGRLDVASKLSGGIQAALRVLAEAEACLGAKTDPVSVAIVDAAGNEASDAALAVAVKLDSACESCSDASSSIANLGGHSKLGNDLSIGVNSSTKAWPEGEVTVLAEETVASSNRSHCSETETGAGVRKALVGVGIDCGNEWTEASKDLLLLRTWVQGENDSGVEQWIAVVFHVLCLSALFHTLGGSGVEAKESGVGRSCWCTRGS